MSDVPTVKLPAFLAARLEAGHPWVYRDHVPKGFRARSGSFVKISAGEFSAFALWDERSPIALRIFSRRQVPDAAWVRERVKSARELRQLVQSSDTNAYRLLFGEADGLPGLTADVYDRHVALVTYADSLEAVLPWVIAALKAELSPLSIVRRKRRGDSAGEARTEAVAGEVPAPFVVREHGMLLEVDLAHGQKTGLFLDHRDNRRFVREHAAGRRVLNLFSYTGAFSVAAALGGARQVISVDSAAPAGAAARRNFELNGIDPGQHGFSDEDAFAYLERVAAEGRRFDLVIADPPSFATSKDQLKRALRAYARLHALCLEVTEPGGFYAAASCTAQVSPEAFRETLAAAGARADVDLAIIHDNGQAIDHPGRVGHVEGRYLKFMATRVTERA
ncbi:MAG TPA: class I SAM-dependent rRNA methyltransferase [Polyangiaceae bacterium]|nr:class I SAM-dependent rRNA methyltransferase [Polyangiaceae bacterium]